MLVYLEQTSLQDGLDDDAASFRDDGDMPVNWRHPTLCLHNVEYELRLDETAMWCAAYWTWRGRTRRAHVAFAGPDNERQ